MFNAFLYYQSYPIAVTVSYQVCAVTNVLNTDLVDFDQRHQNSLTEFP